MGSKRRSMISEAMERARTRRREPMDVILTLKINLGDRPEDAVTVIRERRVPLVGSVFDNRDRIAREFLRLLLKVGLAQPQTLRRLWGPPGRHR
jgi:hypothetical protein